MKLFFFVVQIIIPDPEPNKETNMTRVGITVIDTLKEFFQVVDSDFLEGGYLDEGESQEEEKVDA